MKQILILFKAYIQGVSLLSKGRLEHMQRGWGKQKWMIPLIGIGLVIALFSYGSLLVMNYRSIYQLGAMFGRPDFLLYISMLLSWLMIFIFSFTSAISILYRSSDIQLLMTLPIQTSSIVWSKILILYATMLPLHLFIYLPAVVVMIINYGFSPVMLVSIPLTTLLGPAIPLLVSVAAVSGIMSGSSITKHRTAFEIVGMILMLIVIIGFQALLTRMSSEGLSDSSMIYTFLADRIDQFYTDFPPLGWASGSFLPGGFLSLLRFCGLSVVVGVILGILAGSRYSRTLQLFSSVDKSDHKIRRSKNGGRAYSVTGTLINREWMVIRSNSTFIMQSAMELMIIPLMLVVMSLTGSIGDIEGALSFITGSDYIELLVFGILLMVFVLSSLSATSISREGSRIAISRLLPVSPRVIATAKVKFHILLCYSMFLIYVIAAFLLFDLSVAHLIYMIPGGFIFLSASSMIGLVIDMKRPMLTWNHPQQAMKQNLNVLITMGINMLFLGSIAGISYLMLILSVNTLIIGLFAVAAAAAVVLGLRKVFILAAESCFGPQDA